MKTLIKLKSFSQTFTRYAELDIDKSTLSIKNIGLTPEEVYAMEGTFDLLNDRVLAFFKQSGNRFLFFKDKIIQIENADTLSYKRLDPKTCGISLISGSGESKLEIIYNQQYYGAIDRSRLGRR